MEKKLIYPINIVIAFVLDLIFGDPYRVPHPITYIGKLVKYLEKKLYKFENKKLFGMITNLLVLIIVYTVSYFLSLNPLVNIYFLYTVLATKTLGLEAMKVYKSLKNKDLVKARLQISYLVTRDTENMSEKEVIKGVIETVAENITDAIIAPLFYMFIGGLPLAMTYKAINTMDSMLGYKNEKYINFGYFSAKLDDFANFVPARISGLVLIPLSSIALGYDFKSSLRVYFRDRLKHSSPNSAHTEAAVAGALGITLGGPTFYFGKLEDKPYIGDMNKDLNISHIKSTVKIMYGSAIIGLILFLLIYGGLNGFAWRKYL